ncbi:MAG: hypothetical protein IJ817_01460 [Clostridia bacterium]|nr:hypothetical protein [Clostridia bacterium]
MKNTEKQLLKRRVTRLGLFLLIVFLPVLVVAILLGVAGVKQWVNILILVIMMFVLFALYIFVCEKMDERKRERMNKKKDPFAD